MVFEGIGNAALVTCPGFGRGLGKEHQEGSHIRGILWFIFMGGWEPEVAVWGRFARSLDTRGKMDGISFP